MAAWNFVTTNTGTYPQGYDHEDRFVHFAQAGQSKTFNFTRSDIGNINNINLNGTGTARGFNNIHALTSIGSTTQIFNPDGNLTTSHAGHTNTWDEAGMMKQSVVQTGSAFGIAGTNEYGYDADRKRVWKKITRNSSVAEHSVFVHAGPNLIAHYPAGTAAASPTQEYVYAQEIDSLVMLVRNGGNDKLTITRNQQWSVTALSDSANGNVLERYTYDHFGKRTILEPNGTTVRATSSYNMPFGYTSREHDAETGLMYFRARYYDPHTAEFTSPDPLEYVDGMSLFRGYFAVSGVDSTGEKTEFQFCQIVEQLPDPLDDCGRARAQMRFKMKINAQLGGNLTGVNGWVIQRIESSEHIVGCNGNTITDVSDCFYEAILEVKDGLTFIPGDDQLEDIDTFQNNPVLGEGSVGLSIISGEVGFVRDFNLDMGKWKIAPRDHPAHGLPILPCTEEEKVTGVGKLAGWKPAFKRTLSSEWLCCDCENRKETDVTGSSGWESKCTDFVTK